MNLTRYAESSYLPPPSFTLFSLVPLSSPSLSHTTFHQQACVCMCVCLQHTQVEVEADL